MFSKPGMLFTALAVVIVGLAIHWDFTPAPVDNAPADSSFSVAKAYGQLRQIANKPHSLGTVEKEHVRDFILSQCQALGLSTRLQQSTSVVSHITGVVAGNVTNIIAEYKGQDSLQGPKSALLVMAHYDSQPNAVGAGDDGAGCAAMLETARLIKAGRPLKNNIIFLFTDGEETGLLGSTSFVRDDSLFSQVGAVLNFDGRGNSGKSFMISNGSSGWMVGEYARFCAHKSASSLYHEIFRILPNSTDLLPFSRQGIPGFDFAYIDGFVNYHAMTDRPENIDRNTLQNHGDNMLSLVKHLGSIDLKQPKGTEHTFFNALGNWMILYPVSWNLFFLVLTNLVLLTWLVMGIINRRIRWQGALTGLLSFSVALVLLYFVTSFSLKGVRTAYPLYDDYYSNAYNSRYFYFSVIMLVIAVFTFIYQGLQRKFDIPSLMAGIALVQVIILDGLYSIIPTAIYFLCFPLLFVLFACIIGYTKRSTAQDTAGAAVWRGSALTFAASLPALLLLAPLIYGLFIGFDVQPEAAALGPLTALLLGLLIPLFAPVFRESRWIIPGAAFLLCLLATGFGVLHDKYPAGKPYKTNLHYFVNTDDSIAYWVLHGAPVDAWNRQFFPHPAMARSGYNFAGLRGGESKETVNKADFVNFSAPDITIKKDSVDNGIRKLLLHCTVFDSAASAHFDLDSSCPAFHIAINKVRAVEDSAANAAPGRANGGQHKYRWVDVSGIWPEGFDILFELDPKTPFKFHAISRIMGLPGIQGFHGYPLEMIPGPGSISNTTMASKFYKFDAP